jgi:hypothetical protein
MFFRFILPLSVFNSFPTFFLLKGFVTSIECLLMMFIQGSKVGIVIGGQLTDGFLRNSYSCE